MTDLARLTIQLTADSARLQRDLDKAQSQINRYQARSNAAFTEAAKRIGTGIGIAVSAAAAGLVALVKNSIDAADELNKLSQKVGIAADDLSKLQYAAKLADVDTASLQTSLVKLSKSAVDAADGTGDSADAFRALGVDVKDANGNIKSTNDLLLDTAEAFSQFEDGPEKAAAAVAIFGKAGADLIPLLNGGRKAIEEAGDELERFGGVVTPEAARQAEAFNDNLTRMQSIAKGVGVDLSASLLPALVDVTNALVELRQNDDLKQFARGTAVALAVVAESLVAVAKLARAVGGSFEAVFADIKLLGQVAGSIGSKGLTTTAALEVAAAVSNQTGPLAKALEERNKTVEEANKRYADLWNYNGTFISDAIKRSFEQADTAIANYAPDLSKVPTLEDMFGGGKRRLGLPSSSGADDKNKETKATKELTEAERQFNNEIEARISILDELKTMADALREDESRQNDIGLDAADEIQAEAERIDGILTDLQNKQVEFADTFSGAFEAYADSVKNVGSLLGGDLVSALDSAIARTSELAANTILWGEGGEEALKALGRSIITDVVSSLIRAGLQMAVNFAMQQAFGAAATATALTEAAALATAWTPGAIAASIATLGAADAIGLGAYAAAQASGQAITGAGAFAEGGYTGNMARDQFAGIVHGQEYVLNAAAVSRIGVRNLDDMNEGRFGVSGAAGKAMMGGGQPFQIINNAPGISLTPFGNMLKIDMIPELLEMVDSDQARRASSGLGRNFQTTARKVGGQPSADR